MRTNLLKSINVIRRGSGANLNLFRYTAMAVMLLFTLGIGSTWAFTSDYYSQAGVAVKTGAGTVYVGTSTSYGTSTTGSSVTYADKKTTNASSAPTDTWYIKAEPDAGYAFTSWTTGGSWKSAPNKSTATTSGTITATTSTAAQANAQANFTAVTVNSVSPTSVNVEPTNADNDYEGDITFVTSNANLTGVGDFKATPITDGNFTITWTRDGDNVKASFKFNGGGSYGGVSRNNSTTVSLQSKASGSTAKTCTITANFPALAFVGVEATEVFATQGESGKTGSATFTYNYGAEDDFPTTPTLTHTSGSGSFSVTGYTVTPNFSTGVTTVTVNYELNTNNGVGETIEQLKLNAANGLEKTVTITGHSEALATDDAKVIAADGTTVIYQGDWATAWTKANTAANAGCTLQVLRNVTGGSLNANQKVTNTFTLDLNGKILSANYNGSIIYLNTAGKTLTIKDSKTGGRIENVNNAYAGAAYVCNIEKGNLIFESGTLYCENKGASGRRAVGIYNQAGTTVTMNGGKIEVHGYNNSQGVLQTSNKNNNTYFTMNGGEIEVDGYQDIYGVSAPGKVNINDGTINVTATYSNCRGITLSAAASATAANCYWGTLTMKGGTINSTCTADADGNRYAYGIFFDCSNAAMGTAVATDGSHGNKAASTGTIENATINVSTLGRSAFGIRAYGSYQSKTDHYDVIQIKNTKIDVTSKYYYTYGVYADCGINGTCGAIYAANIELTNCDVTATTTKNHTAYCLWATTTATTIYKNAQPNYYGEYAGGATITVNSGTYTANTGTTTAYAIGSSTRSKTTFHSDSNVAEECKLGEGVEGYATLNIHGGEFTATSGTTTARAVSSGGHTTIDGGTFTANAGTSTAYAIYAISGTLDVAGVEVNAEANSTAVGVYVDCAISTISGFKYYADATLKNLTVTAITRSGAEADGVLIANYKRNLTAATLKSDSTSNKWSTASYNQYANIYQYGEYAVGPKCSIIGGTYTAKSATTTAYGVRLNGPAISADSDNDGTVAYAYGELNITNAKITSSTEGTTTVYGVWTGGPTTITNCDITASSKTTTCSGVLIEAGKTTISGTTITATGIETVRGIYVNSRIAATNSTQNVNTEFSGVAGFECVGELEASDNIVTASATSGNTAYGIYLHSVKGNTASGPFMGDHAIAGKAIINSGTYKATATGTTAYGICLNAQTQQGDVLGRPKCIVTGGKFSGVANGGTDGAVNGSGQLGYFVLSGGFYNKNTNLSKYKEEGLNVNDVLAGTPEYTEGYRYKISSELSGAAVCKVYQSSTLKAEYATLEEALQYVNANTGTNLTIVMVADYTLKKGDYILPSNATLIVPESLTRKSAMGTKPSREVVSPPVPVQFLMLTFDKGANMTVKGTIETSAVNTSANGGAAIAGAPHGNYGRLHLVEGSTMTLESGANLNCWGYITGKGEINALNGATVREGFQLGYWRGGTATSAMLNNKSTWHAFPVTDYFIQSVEAPILFRPGAKLLGYSSVNVSWPVGQQDANDVQLLGTNNSMFLMNPAEASEDTYVRKEYDPETDRAIWTVNSGAKLGSFSFSLAGNTVNSADYYLPVSNNMTIYVNEGEFTVTQDALLIPGAQIIISKLGKLTVASGKRLFVMDNEDWPGFVTHSTGAVSRWYYNALYSPSWTTNPRTLKYPPTTTRLPDAEIFVQGETEGSYYTSTSGANIHSTNDDAGKVKFVAAAGADNSIQHVVNTDNDRVTINFTTAQLKNETPETPYTSSKGTVAGEAFVYMEQQWVKVTDGCLTTRTDGSGTHEYAKPSDVVEVVSNGDNAYRDVATNSRYFINAEKALSNDQCVWWEVEPVTSGTYAGDYMANQEKYDNYGAYYYWDGSDGYWKPRYVTVTWKNQDGSTLATYTNVMCNTSPKYLSASPTWANTSIEKHDWVGWRDADGNIYDKNAVLPVAQGNVTYTAYYNVSKYEYTIKFVNPDKTVIWAGLVEAGTIPECPVEPTQAPTVSTVYTFTGWNTTPVEVTGTATYTAVYSSSERKYHVTFYNYDAQTVLYEADVDYNTRPVYAGVTPFRANTSSFSYEWTGWQKGSDTYDTDDDLAFVTGNVNYIAIYSQTDLKYQVFFKRQDGSIIDAPLFNYEDTPEAFPANPTLASTVSTDYTFDHWEPAELVSVTEEGKVYTAYFSESPRQYTAHFVNYDGKTLNADQTIYYNTVPAYTGATPFKPNDSRNSFEFSGWTWAAGEGWEAGSIGVGEAFPAIKGDITFTAQFTEIPLQFNVIYKRADGTPLKEEKLKWGQSTTGFPSPVASYDDDTYTYTFDHWNPAAVTNPVTADATYTAYFNQAIKTYSISNFGISPAGYGTVSPASVTGIPSGSSVTVNGNKITVNGQTITATPTATTAEYTYAFSKWNNVPNTVTANVTNITAEFTRTINQYTLTVEANNDAMGTVSGGGTYDYNTVRTITASPKSGFKFVKWNDDNTNASREVTVTADVTFMATFDYDIANYTVKHWKQNINNNEYTEVTEDRQVIPGTIGATTEAAANSYTGFTPKPIEQQTIAVGGSTVVNIYYDRITYTITWKNGDGNTIETDENVKYGATPAYSGTTPTKTATAQYTYTFNNTWSPAIVAVTGEATYTAQFGSTVNKYTITWVDGNGETLKTEQVAYGTTPAYTGATPTKTATDQYTYTFNNTWSPAIVAVTGAATYTAQFGSTVNKYDITWVDGNGETLKTEQVEYGTTPTYTGATPTKTATDQYTYTFNNTWSPAIVAVEGAATYTAQFGSTVNKYDITWVDGNGATLKTEQVEYGATPAYTGETPTKTVTDQYTYTFNNTWSPAIVSVTGAATYTAQFGSTVNKYDITWVDGNGATLKTEQVEYGQIPAYTGATPTKTATAQCTYTFNNTWSPAIVAVTGEATYTAQFGSTVNKYTITWVDGNGATLKTEQVEYGQTPAYTGATPTKTATAQYSYTFNNTWSPAIVAVTGDATYTAQFGSTVNEYTITWVDGNGETLKTEQVEYSATPAYTGETPTKSATVQYTYTFSGWSPAIASVTGEATYTAQFNETVRKYTITWLDDADNVIDYTEVAYGQTPTHDASKPSDGCWNYTFDKWTPAIASVTEDATYKASFTKNAIEYTITWQNVDGTVLIETLSFCDDNPSYLSHYYGLPTHPTYPLLYEFSGWKNEQTGVVYAKDAVLPEPTADETYTAQYTSVLKLDVADEQTIAIDATVDVTTVHVEGKLDVTSGSLTTEDLILEGTPNSSGEIIGAGTITATRALFHFTQPGGFKARTWYAVAVPWEVEVPAGGLGGVYLKKGEGDYVQQRLGKTYDLIYYDGARRATGVNKAWNYVEDDAAAKQIMYPGRAYMIYLTSDADMIRFERKDGADLLITEIEAHTYGDDNTPTTLANWNGIANPATYHAYLNVGATDGRGQVYNPDTKQYNLFKMNENKLVVGQPIFVQSAVDGTVVANSTTYSPSLAPRRSKAWTAPFTRYELMLAASEADVTDRVIVRMDEDKEEDSYTVGQDLAKMGVSSVVPQMWIDRYDSKMCINTVAGLNHTADYPLGIFAPKDGEYNLFMDDQPNDETMLYLTYDGEAIWNLSYGGYVTYLTKGTDTHYGLRIVARKPQITTGIEETTIQNGDPIRKVMVDGKVYIIRNGEIYSVTGQKTK